MRILFCNYEYPPLGGGGGVVMAALARELARRHEVTVLTSRALGLEKESRDAGVRVIRVPVPFRKEAAVANMPSMLAYPPAATLRGLMLSRTQKFDVINTHFVVPSGPAGQLLARLFDVPNVLSVHGGDLYDPSKKSSPHRHAWLRQPIRSMLYGAAALVAQSRNTAQNVRDIYAVERETKLIPLGIDRPAMSGAPASRSELNIPADAFVLATVGRVVPRKATSQLVRALKMLGNPALHLLVMGDGPDLEATRAAAADAGLSGQVHFLGQVDEARKFALLRMADAFVSTSQHEGFGLVFLEAMACGLPVICYDHGGQTDFLVDGQTGYVVKLNELEQFAQGLKTLQADPALRRRMAQHNLELVNQYFIDTCAAAYEKEFETAIRNHPRSKAGPH